MSNVTSQPKLDEENPFPDSPPTGKSQQTSPIPPPTLTENSSDAHLLDDPYVNDDDFTRRRLMPPHDVPEDPFSQKRLHKSFDFTVNEYNRLMKSNSVLERAKIVKAIQNYVGPNIRFFITFEADDIVTKQHVTFQADVVFHYNNGQIVILFIGDKGRNKELRYPVDLDDQNEKDTLNESVVDVIASYNDDPQEKPRLEFVKIVKAVKDVKNVVYRIAFEARNPESGQIGTYYAEAIYAVGGGFLAPSFMPKDEMKDEFFFKLRVDPLREGRRLA